MPDSQRADNGYVDPYPHGDFEAPCAGPCCIPEAYDSHPWTCGGEGCSKFLKQAGLCVECTEKVCLCHETIMGKEPICPVHGDIRKLARGEQLCRKRLRR